MNRFIYFISLLFSWMILIYFYKTEGDLNILFDFNIRLLANEVIEFTICIVTFLIFLKANNLYTKTNDKRMAIIAGAFGIGTLLGALHIAHFKGIIYEYLSLENLFVKIGLLTILLKHFFFSGGILFTVIFSFKEINKNANLYRLKLYSSILIITIILILFSDHIFSIIPGNFLYKSFLLRDSLGIIDETFIFVSAIIYADMRYSLNENIFSALTTGLLINGIAQILYMELHMYPNLSIFLNLMQLTGYICILTGISEIQKTPKIINLRQRILVYSSLIILLSYIVFVPIILAILNVTLPNVANIILLSALLIIAVLNYFLVSRFIKPITDIIKIMDNYKAGEKLEKIPVTSNDEIGMLIEKLNKTNEERWEYVEELEKAKNREKLLANIISTIRNSLDINKIKKTIVSVVGRAFMADRCIIRMFDSSTNKLLKIDNNSEYLSSSGNVSLVGKPLPADLNEYVLDFYHNNKNCIFTDLENEIKTNQDRELKTLYDEFSTKSIYKIPIFNNNKLLAVLVLHYTQNKVILKKEEIELLESIAVQAGIALEHAELHYAIKQKASESALIKKIIDVTGENLSLNTIFEIAANEIIELFNIDRIVITTINNNENDIAWNGFWDFKAKDTYSTITTSDFHNNNFAWLNKNVISYGKDIIINDINELEVPDFYKEIHKKYLTKSILNTPIKRGDEVLGAISVMQIENFRYWSNSDIELMHTIADQIYIAIKIIEQQTKITRQAEREKVLRNTITNIRNSLKLDETLQAICKEISDLFACPIVDLVEFRDKNESSPIKLRISTGSLTDSLNKLDTDKVYDEWMTFFTSDNGIVSISDIANSSVSEFIKYNTQLVGFNSIINIPIQKGAKMWGALLLADYKCRDWTEEEKDSLRTIADHIYVAIQQADLYTKLHNAVKVKDDFLANMSHEFRTPLNAVIGFSDMILSGTYGQLPDKVIRYQNHISKSGRHLLGLVNDLLDISKVEAGKMKLNYEFFNSKTVIKEVLNTFEPMANSKSIYLSYNLDKVNLLADMGRFRQIIFNLVSNAIKFTPEGGNIYINSAKHDENLLVTIEDTGIGIEKADYHKIFEQFSQIDSSYSRRYEGTGLGLDLTKKLVELHGGTIDFESESGKGTKFYFSIPNEIKQTSSEFEI